MLDLENGFVCVSEGRRRLANWKYPCACSFLYHGKYFLEFGVRIHQKKNRVRMKKGYNS